MAPVTVAKARVSSIDWHQPAGIGETRTPVNTPVNRDGARQIAANRT